MQIGNTPLIRLEKVTPGNGVEIWVKWEGANPTGSMKDRMALSMVQGAIGRGELAPGGRLIEWTGGSTGSSLAMVCAMFTCATKRPSTRLWKWYSITDSGLNTYRPVVTGTAITVVRRRCAIFL